jgi:putative transcriptional regulator
MEKEIVRRNWLKDLRKEKGFTVRDIAKEFGVSFSHYSGIENGKKNPSLPLALKISKFLGFNIEDFYKGMTL